MGIRLPSMIHNVKHIIKGKSLHCRNQPDVPKGHVAIYVGEMQRKRFVVPISYLSHPSFQDLLNRAEEEFGFNPPMGCLTIPCREEAFINLASTLQFSENALAARVAHARLLLEAAKFSGEISGQQMVDPGRSDVEGSDCGGIDGR
eukprot:XP_024448984.1 auxin-responsive protein SAUR21-like [Populus trichocarpa]